MLKTLTTRTHQDPAGEPEAWRRPREMRPVEERASWSRSGEEAVCRVGGSASTCEVHSRDVTIRDAHGSGRHHSAACASSARAGAGVENVREPGRTIERSGQHGSSARPERLVQARSSLDDLRHGSGRDARPAAREALPLPPEELSLAGLAREVARAADKADVARLEEMLTHVLRRLSALEERRGERAAPVTAPASAEAGMSDAEARWAARRARAAVQRSSRPAAPAEAETPLARSGAAPRRLWS